ncbi:unnamed protein product, partial [Rotaria sp. Silwood2]
MNEQKNVILNVLLTYDISEKNTEVKNALKQEPFNYREEWALSDKKPQILPETTLWKPSTTSRQALADIQSLISNLNSQNGWNIILERCVTVDFATAA